MASICNRCAGRLIQQLQISKRTPHILKQIITQKRSFSEMIITHHNSISQPDEPTFDVETLTSNPPKLSTNEQKLKDLTNEITILINKKDFAFALEKSNEAVELAKSIFGDFHPVYASALNNKALCLKKLLKSTESLKVYEKALSIYSESLGNENRSTLSVQYNIALLLKQLGRLEECETLLTDCLSKRKKVLEKSDLNILTTISSLSKIKFEIRKFDDAIELQSELILNYKRRFGSKYIMTANAFNQLAEIYQAKNDFNEALKYFETALKIKNECLPPTHPSIIKTLESIKQIHLKNSNDV